MALIPSVKYPGQVLTSDPVGYPQGKARNDITEGDGTGTPWEEALLNDMWGFQQALLKAAGITPTGNPDKVTASQYLDSLNALFEPLAGGRDLQNWNGTLKNVPLGTTARGISYQPVARAWILVGGIDLAAISLDDGLTWVADVSGMSPNAINLDDVANSRANDIWLAVGIGATVYTRTGISGAWGTDALPGSPERVRTVFYDSSNALFIILGNVFAGTAPYLATSPGAALSWTDRSASIIALPNFGAEVLSSGVANESGVSVVAASFASKTKLLRSANGTTWVEITSTLVSDTYTVGYNPVLDKFMAWGIVAGNIYTSTDGDTWTLVGAAALVAFTAGDTPHRAIGSLGGIWVVGAELSGAAIALYALDATDLTASGWSVQMLAAEGDGLNAMCFAEDGTNGKVLAGIDQGTDATIYGSTRQSPMT